MGHVTHLKWSRRNYEWVTSRTWMSHDIHRLAAWHHKSVFICILYKWLHKRIFICINKIVCFVKMCKCWHLYIKPPLHDPLLYASCLSHRPFLRNRKRANEWLCVWGRDKRLQSGACFLSRHIINEVWWKYKWITSQVWMSHVTHLKGSRRNYEWVTSRMWMSRDIHRLAAWHHKSIFICILYKWCILYKCHHKRILICINKNMSCVKMCKCWHLYIQPPLHVPLEYASFLSNRHFCCLWCSMCGLFAGRWILKVFSQVIRFFTWPERASFFLFGEFSSLVCIARHIQGGEDP